MTYRHKTDGKKISLLGFGAMRLPTVDGGHANGWAIDGYSGKAIDQALFNSQVKMMLDKGLNYFDTSPAYCRGESETCLGIALEKSGYDREDYVIATKMSNFSPTQYSLAACKKMFGDSLKALRTSYIDNYLLHNVGNGGYETFKKRYLENGAASWCLDLRAQGKIRNLGFSFHGDRRAWDWCIENHSTYKWDFALIQMNYVDWLHAKELSDKNLVAKYLYDTLTSLKIPVVVMEPLLGGRLARYNWALANRLTPLDPEASLASWALRFCGSFDNVMCVLSGMTYSAHIEENIETFSPLKKLTDKELGSLEEAAVAFLALNTIACNCCNYCMPCPYGLDIPGILTFRNEILSSKKKLRPKEIIAAYKKAIPQPLRRAEHCTGCGKCNSHCPQSIDIPKEIAKIDAWIDEVKNALV
jgi:predicted aldo/keto reductase-like oxidoreductase